MYRHLYVVHVVTRPQQQLPQRPAKVVQLEARREARLEAARVQPVLPTRPAA
jgi:hypothetical protein